MLSQPLQWMPEWETYKNVLEFLTLFWIYFIITIM